MEHDQSSSKEQVDIMRVDFEKRQLQFKQDRDAMEAHISRLKEQLAQIEQTSKQKAMKLEYMARDHEKL
jgi:hypothetical protein